MLERGADLLEHSMERLCELIVREAGRTMPNAISEVREAADFCRYYAAQARALEPGPRAAWARGLHQPVELSAGDFHRPDRGGACGGKSGARQAGRSRRR